MNKNFGNNWIYFPLFSRSLSVCKTKLFRALMSSDLYMLHAYQLLGN